MLGRRWGPWLGDAPHRLSFRLGRSDGRGHHQRAGGGQGPGRRSAKPSATSRAVERIEGGVGEHAQQRHVALLHADVPQQEGGAQRPQPKARARPRRPVRRAGSRSRRRGCTAPASPRDEARRGEAFARDGGEEPRGHRVARPHQGAAQGQDKAPAGVLRPAAGAELIVHQDAAAARAEEGAGTWASCRRCAGQQAREKHGQQRPQRGMQAVPRPAAPGCRAAK